MGSLHYLDFLLSDLVAKFDLQTACFHFLQRVAQIYDSGTPPFDEARRICGTEPYTLGLVPSTRASTATSPSI